jgi:low affinity Fe/Cu permease
MTQPTRWRDGLSATARLVVAWVGSGAAAALSLVLVAAWLLIGLIAGFSDRWLDVLFAVSGAVTFVMVFFIQHSTARDLRAILIKLDELVSADDAAHDDVIGAEHRPLNEQEQLEQTVRARARG